MGSKHKSFVLLLVALILMSIAPFQSIVVAQNAVDQEWNIAVADSDKNGAVGMGSSLALDSNGNPHISYVDWQLQLKYAVWSIWGWNIQTVYSDAAPQYTSLALDSKGNPHIMFTKSERASDLMYASWTGSNWDIQAVNVDSADTLNSYSSLALDSNDNPYIAYFDFTNLKMKLTSNTGSGWKTQTLDSTESNVYFTSLALDSNANPHIVYQESSTSNSASPHPIYQASLKYAKWTGNQWHIQIIEPPFGGPIGYGSSIALDSNGNPIISYFNDIGGLGCVSWDGQSWNFNQLTFSEPNFNPLNSMTSIRLDASNNPYISYYDGVENLSYASSNGSLWSIQTVAQIKETTNVHSSLALDNNSNPHISFFDNDLKYAVFANAALGKLFIVVGLIIAILAIISSTLFLYRKYCKTVNS